MKLVNSLAGIANARALITCYLRAEQEIIRRAQALAFEISQRQRP